MSEPLRIRYSETAAFRRCRRKWWNAYVLNLTTETEPFTRAPGTNSTGTYVHKLLEAHYDGGSPETVLAELTSEVPEDSPFAAEWLAAIDLAYAMFTGYVDWTLDTGADQGEQTVGTELTLEYEILPGTFITGTLDRLVYDCTWDRHIVDDSKTVASLDKGQQFAVDTQLATYVLLARKNGYPATVDARHTMLRRVRQSARSKPPYYGRAEVTFNDEQIDAHEAALRATVEDMLRVRDALASGDTASAYPSPTKDCSWDCPFLGICAAHTDGSDLDGLRAALYTERQTTP